jgi:signal transduction histidine kinase
MVVAAVVAPNLASVVLVGEAWKDKAIFPHWEDEIYGAAAGLAITDLSGLVMWKLRDKVASLLDRSAILYSAIYCDSEGNCYPPALSLVAKSANGPFVVACETFLGHGPIGDFAPLLDMIGHDAGRFGMRIPAGVSPSTIPLTTGHDLKPLFDWRQMQRWRVAGSDLPEGSQIRLRTPTVWEQYRWQSLTALAVILAQAFLIAGMLYERRHRRKAEIEARRRMSELAHLNRQATAGEMTASIAHQLNQPLAAILSNAEAAEGLLKNPSPDLQELAEILADIRRDDERASEMIKHLRRLLRKGEFESYLFDVNDTLRDVFRFLSVPALIRGVRLETEVSPSAIYVRGDRIQLEQVVLNLVMNGIDAVADQPNERRRIIGRTEPVDGKSVLVSVADFGQGIAAEELARVFDPFFTTKEQGMGIGLSIARTIVEAHGGRIWAENQPGAGAAFHVSLPLAATERCVVPDGRRTPTAYGRL